MMIQKSVPIPKVSPEVVIKVDKHIPIPRLNWAEEDYILHNLSATAKYHANHLHNSGCYDDIDAFHDRMAYNYVIGTIRYARKIGLL